MRQTSSTLKQGRIVPNKVLKHVHMVVQHEPARIRLVLIEQNRLLRDTVASMLRASREIELLNAAETAAECSVRPGAPPNIVLVNFGKRILNVPEVVKKVQDNFPKGNIIVMGFSYDIPDIIQWVKSGVAGFILEDASREEILATIQTVASGGNVLPLGLNASLFSQIISAPLPVGASKPFMKRDFRMTGREQEVIALITEGLSNKEIAHRLNIATYTIKSHVHNIMEKLNLHSRLQVANFAQSDSENEEAG